MGGRCRKRVEPRQQSEGGSERGHRRQHRFGRLEERTPGRFSSAGALRRLLVGRPLDTETQRGRAGPQARHSPQGRIDDSGEGEVAVVPVAQMG